MNPIMAGQVRTLLAAAGGFAVAKGWADDATVQAVLGVAPVLLAAAWSAWAPEKRTRRR